MEVHSRTKIGEEVSKQATAHRLQVSSSEVTNQLVLSHLSGPGELKLGWPFTMSITVYESLGSRRSGGESLEETQILQSDANPGIGYFRRFTYQECTISLLIRGAQGLLSPTTTTRTAIATSIRSIRHFTGFGPPACLINWSHCLLTLLQATVNRHRS